MTTTDTNPLDGLLADAVQDGRANEICCGLMSVSLLAALLFLDDAIQDNGHVLMQDQERLSLASRLVRAKAVKFGEIAAAKLCSSQPKDTQSAFSGSLAAAIVALVSLEESARACGGNPDAARGMMLMAAHGILKDLRASLKGGPQ